MNKDVTELLFNTLSEGAGIQNLIDTAREQIFLNPIMVTNSSFRIVGLSTDTIFDDIVWNEAVNLHGFSKEVIEQFRHDTESDKLFQEHKVFLYSSGLGEKIPRILAPLKTENRTLGYLIIFSVNHPLENRDIENAEILAKADEGVIIASNNTGLIGQSTTDYEAIQKLKDHADSKHMMGLTINGVRCHGVMLKQSDHYIYAYVPDSIIFQTLLQNVIMCLFIYLIVVALIWMIYRKLQKNILKIEKEKEQKYQKSLLEAAKKADAANRAKTEFLQRMSHDIRTPINGICGMLDVGDYYRDDLSRQTECRGKIREASNILKELVNEVLDMSKLESGEIYLEEKPFNIYQIINEVIDVVGKMADEREIKVEHKTPEIIHKDLIGSPIHLKRLLMNILSNAVKYNKDYGKIYLSSREISSDQDGVVMMEFICQDTGIGMSEEFQKHLFEPFAQEQKGGASKFGGTGLGMPITKSLLEKMGGTITFISEQGVGTTFVITIPFKINEDVARDEEKQEEVTASIRGLNILLVEDNELNMEIAEFVIQSEGASVVKAWNGQEAVEAFEKSASGEFDAILMDVMMPVMNGYEATKMIRSMDRSDAKKIPIIAMTANAFVEDRIKSKEAGMNEHVSKPIDMKLLVKIIAELAGKIKIVRIKDE